MKSKLLSFVFLLMLGNTCLAQPQSYFEFKYDPCGNRTKRQFIVLRIADVKDSLNEFADSRIKYGLEIYPNPTSHKVNVTLSQIEEGEKATFILSDLEGKILFIKETSFSNEEIDLSAFKNGIYFLRIFIKEEKMTYKITKVD